MSMSGTGPLVRPARAADFRAFYGRALPRSGRAWVAELDGKVIGLAGYYLMGGRAFVFSDMDEAMARYPVTIMREARRLMAGLRLPALCIADPARETSGRFLERLGWRLVGPGDEGDIYAWTP